MNKLLVNLKHAVSANALLHGALMAFLAALATALIPILQGNGLPTFAQIYHAVELGIAAGILYILKNIIAGTSSPNSPTT